MTNQTLMRAENDIDTVKQYLNLAARVMQRAISTLQAERLTATQARRDELDRVADQSAAELTLIERAHDGMQGIDTAVLKMEEEAAACIS